MFTPTYLYVKTHNKTGLMYFGKTIRDPMKYLGSGKKWIRHIKKHGNDVSTKIIGYYTNEEQCRTDALEFSVKNNIVESKNWANLKLETLDGGDTSMTLNFKQSMTKKSIDNKKRRWWNNGTKQIFVENPESEDFHLGRLPFNNSGAQLGANAIKNKFWITDGKSEKMISKTDNLPNGFRPGRIQSPKKNLPNLAARQTKWWNNGHKEVMKKNCPGPEWVQGRISK